MEPSGGDVGLAVMIHRELAGMKGTDLGAESSVSDKTISVWKKGDRTPSRKLVQKVAVALKNPLAEIGATGSWGARRPPPGPPSLPPPRRPSWDPPSPFVLRRV